MLPAYIAKTVLADLDAVLELSNVVRDIGDIPPTADADPTAAVLID